LGYDFKIAKSKEELEKVYHFRWQIYSEKGYIDSHSYSDEKFTDRYDEVSTNLAAFHRNQIVGACRLTPFSSKNIGMPIFDYFNIVIPPEISSQDKFLEIGRFVIKKKYRGNRRLVAFGLAALAYLYSIKHDIRWWLAFMPEGLSNSFRSFGVRGAYFKPLKELPLTEKNLNLRKEMSGYFKNIEAKPMYLDLYSV
jgi:N-acyl-L-homoserine lactone synthetase